MRSVFSESNLLLSMKQLEPILLLKVIELFLDVNIYLMLNFSYTDLPVCNPKIASELLLILPSKTYVSMFGAVF